MLLSFGATCSDKMMHSASYLNRFLVRWRHVYRKITHRNCWKVIGVLVLVQTKEKLNVRISPAEYKSEPWYGTCCMAKLKCLGTTAMNWNYEGSLKSRGLTFLLRVGTLWRCGDGLFFEVPPLASDALHTTLHPLQTVCLKLQEDSGTGGFDLSRSFLRL
jgi:hypothetical protein